jgi:ribosomal protein S18 acetylase RimI-like enzyme
MEVTLRPVLPADESFLLSVYASTRERELAQTGWTDAEKLDFLQQQFAAQKAHYQAYFPTASFQVVLLAGQAVGRLYVERNDAEIRIIDIALVSAHRSAGIGTQLLRDLLAEADDSRRPLRIHVEPENPVLGWYRRLGFREIESIAFYLFMEYAPRAK